MPTYRRRTRIRAPLSVVWAFHSTVAGLAAVTPDWMNLDVEAVRGPDGETFDRLGERATGRPDEEAISGPAEEAIGGPDEEAISGPDEEAIGGPADGRKRASGDADLPALESGSRLRLSIRPFGRGPRQRWVTRIADREVRDGAAYFRDEMLEGPFPTWIHTHAFFADGEETILLDEVEYELPFGGVGRAVGPAASVGFEATFRYRHARTKELLDGRRELPPRFGEGGSATSPTDDDGGDAT